MQQNQQNQEIQQPLRPEKKVSNYWMYGSFGLIGIIALLWFGKKLQTVNTDIVFYVCAAGLAGWAYYLWWKKKEEPSYEKMVETVRVEMFKIGKYLNLDANNIFIEPIGSDYFACHIADEGLTFELFKNRLIGCSSKSISDLQRDINKMTMQQALARNGVIQVIE